MSIIGMQLRDLVATTGGIASPGLNPQARLRGASVTAARCRNGFLFLPLEAGTEKMLGRATRNGAIAGLTDRDDLDPALPWIRVDDVAQAAAALGHQSRRDFRGTMIGVTGTAGKTSTKSMLLQVFQGVAKTRATHANRNLCHHHTASLMTLADSLEVYIAEIALQTNTMVAQSAAITRPHIGLVTNIGMNHAESFDDPSAGILAAKMALFDHLEPGGTAVICSATERFDEMRAVLQEKGIENVITCGFSADDTVFIRDMIMGPDGSEVTITVDGQDVTYYVPFAGDHMVLNSALVAGALRAAGKPLEAMRVIADTPPTHSAPRRYCATYPAGRVEIVADTFNTGSESVKALMRIAAARRPTGKKYLLVGDSRALGDHAVEIHHAFADPINAAGFDAVFTVGPFTGAMADDLGCETHRFEDRFDALTALGDVLGAGDLVFIKGPSSNGFRDLVTRLSDERDLTLADPDWTVDRT